MELWPAGAAEPKAEKEEVPESAAWLEPNTDVGAVAAEDVPAPNVEAGASESLVGVPPKSVEASGLPSCEEKGAGIVPEPKGDVEEAKDVSLELPLLWATHESLRPPADTETDAKEPPPFVARGVRDV